MFCSPMTTVRVQAAIMGSLFPTCLFNTLPNLHEVRSAAGSSPIRFAPGVGEFHTAAPFSGSSPPSRLGSGRHFALRGSSPPDHRFRSDLLWEASPPKRPDLPRSSRANCGSWLEVRYSFRRLAPPISWNQFNFSSRKRKKSIRFDNLQKCRFRDRISIGRRRGKYI
jgi:hypothetical protein